MGDEWQKLREEYSGEALRKQDAAKDPIDQFQRWWDQALAAEIELANAMALATADVQGRPSVRVVLLKGFDSRGFVFYTNYASRKCEDLVGNPYAAATLWWRELSRQVRIEGQVSRTTNAESDNYFASRPRASNLGAIASKQSQVVANRERLVQEVAAVDQASAGGALQRPDAWGGLRLAPSMYEFWQGRGDRLHDRLRYTFNGDSWCLDRLAP